MDGKVNLGRKSDDHGAATAGLAVTIIVSEDIAVAFGLTWTGVGMNWQLIPAGAFGHDSETCPWKLFVELICIVNT